MLISDVVTMAQNLANVPNTSFWTATEQLQQANLSYKQIYAFLAQNDDDYFVTTIYTPGGASTANSLTLTGGVTSGSAVVTFTSTTGIVQGMVATDTSGYVPTGTQVLAVDSATQITLSANATATNASDSLTFTFFVADANRSYTWIAQLPYDFFRLRLMQYVSSTGTITYLPFYKMTIQNFANTQNSPGYRIVGDSLEVYDPNNYSQYCMWYYPAPATLTTGSDLVYPTNFFPEAMAYLMAAEIRRKQHSDPSLWVQKAGELMQAMTMQKSRDDASAVAPKNIFDDYYGIWNI